MNNFNNEDNDNGEINNIIINIPIIGDIDDIENNIEYDNIDESKPIETMEETAQEIAQETTEESAQEQAQEPAEEKTEQLAQETTEEKNNENSKKNTFTNEIYEWLEAVALSVVIVVLIFTFILRIVVVDGSSMIDTLHNSDRIIISNLFYKPAVKDIIVFLPKGEIENNKPYVKRIIATEGQVVNIDTVNHKVFVDGVELNEPYIKELVAQSGNQTYPLTVPKGHLFVMGDNRNNSLDSRFSQVGTVDKRFIIGRAIFRIYPLDKMGSVDN